MNATSLLKSLPLVLAVAFPATLAAQAFDLPAMSASYTFAAFFVVLTIQMLAVDYRAPKPLKLSAAAEPVSSPLPLAA
ncbi:MAG TPA: hypothetical protein VHE61_22210 [Opitutaceae bacterium]|nr:hypothetical protein [Opitutaceae bacterium]